MVKDITLTNNFLKLKRALQIFQSERLNRTYEDIKNDPQYKKLGNFFFNKLYAPEDFSFRDTSMKKLHKVLDGKIYKNMLTAVTKVIELHELSDELDNLMVKKMMAQGIDENLTMDEYKEIYTSLDNYDQRIYQINLSAEVTRIFHGLSKKWIVAISLKTVKTTAVLFGIKDIIDFIYDGYVSFKTIDNIDFFLNTMVDRETAWHNEIWAGQPGGLTK
ncbi:MAG: hypothetical protein KKE44_01590 [Proteobacteria bacterium]|nr:hypothetical protein [Pseudomonadota bacterium]MBU1581420.1 hypothetical protein [Pseudomonadota bacterium]MBU2452423.1 hypothetical protein [Pseudomonadota bacterium]MBU2631783.1 hypothetical protein [Pseudomonadota bacterium]